jgi:hypothetical protein
VLAEAFIKSPEKDSEIPPPVLPWITITTSTEKELERQAAFTQRYGLGRMYDGAQLKAGLNSVSTWFL